ncbi:dihydroorotate dehydrogenase [Candidatus Micrarchaeota archaeon]|nr:dihydroorotate dehydrogenase [Candidatus Micrarchaeota archaeon]
MMSILLAKKKLANPTVLASGILGTSAMLMQYVGKCGAGAVTTKSCNLQGRTGHPNPSVISTEHFMLNAVGLSNPGAEEERETVKELKRKTAIPVIASVFERSPAHFAEVAALISRAEPDFIELDLSCPNVESEQRMKGYGEFASNPDLAFKVVSEVKDQCRLPVFAKLSPNCSDIAVIARACEEAGADGITAINTAKGMVIQPELRRPVLANRSGGVSGPALKPIAIKSVYDVYEAVDIPIIGTGGVTTGRDAVEMMMAGACAVGVGSAVYWNGFNVFKSITREMQGWMKKNHFTSVRQLVGAAHE